MLALLKFHHSLNNVVQSLSAKMGSIKIICLSVSAYRQVHGIQFLHSSPFSAFLFMLTHDSTTSSSSIPFRGLSHSTSLHSTSGDIQAHLWGTLVFRHTTCGAPLVSTGRGILCILSPLRGARDRGPFLSCWSFLATHFWGRAPCAFFRWLFRSPLTTCIIQWAYSCCQISTGGKVPIIKNIIIARNQNNDNF